jgi:hypothetical protein
VLPVAFIACRIPRDKARAEAEVTDGEDRHRLKQRVPWTQVKNLTVA